jgi:PAS domain S-box-containing protein
MTSGKKNLKEKKRSAGRATSDYVRLFEHAPVGYFVMDRSGTVQQVNEVALSLVGLTLSQTIGKNFSDFP